MIRGLNDLSEEEAAKLQPRLPIGFFDPDVFGELEDGSKQPLRLIEYEALSGREEPLSDDEIEQMRAEMREHMPETLASAQMPGYEFLGVRETKLGAAPGADVRVSLGRRAAGLLRRRPRPHRVGGGSERHVPRLPPLLRRGVGSAPVGARHDPRVVRAHGARRDRGRGGARGGGDRVRSGQGGRRLDGGRVPGGAGRLRGGARAGRRDGRHGRRGGGRGRRDGDHGRLDREGTVRSRAPAPAWSDDGAPWSSCNGAPRRAVCVRPPAGRRRST